MFPCCQYFPNVLDLQGGALIDSVLAYFSYDVINIIIILIIIIVFGCLVHCALPGQQNNRTLLAP